MHNTTNSSSNLSFETALEKLRNGLFLSRRAWQAKDLNTSFLAYTPSHTFLPSREPYTSIGKEVFFKGHFDKITIIPKGVVNLIEAEMYNFTHEDMTTADWYIYNPK